MRLPSGVTTYFVEQSTFGALGDGAASVGFGRGAVLLEVGDGGAAVEGAAPIAELAAGGAAELAAGAALAVGGAGSKVVALAEARPVVASSDARAVRAIRHAPKSSPSRRTAATPGPR